MQKDWKSAIRTSKGNKNELSPRRSHYKLTTVLDHAVDGLIAINKHGTIEHFNPSSEQIFGYKSAEVVGRNIEILLAPPETDGPSSDIIEYLSVRTEPPSGMESRTVQARHKGGSVSPMELILSAFDHADGRYVPGILRDISARKLGQERKALLAAIVASSEDAIISATLNGIITSWNISAERLLCYSAADSIGRHMNFLVPPEKREEEENILLRLARGEEIQSVETLRLRQDGQRICVSLTISPVRDMAGQIAGVSMIMRDISSRKKAEAELLRYTHALERSNKELDDFAYIASHDLKEPLRGLYNNATFLLEDYEDKLDEQAVRRLRRLCYLSQRMEQLVNDLLYFSRLGRQELAIQPTDLTASIEDIGSMLETTLHEQNARLVVPNPLPTVVCDRVGVTEIFRNLITNAIKYNDREDKVVEIGYIEELQTKSGLERDIFYVRDNGIGIEERFYEDIFRIFKRLNQEDDSKKGTGVGLTFVQKIVERHGGRIWLESTPGVGTTFYFTLAPGASNAAV